MFINYIKNYAIILIFTFLFIAKIGILLLTLNKGIDLTDEGWFLLNLNFPNEDKTAFTSFHLLLSSHLPFYTFNIINIRLLRLISELISTVFLVYASINYLLKTNSISFKQKIFLYGFTLLGFYTSVFTRNIGYYEFTNHLLAILFGLLLIQIHKNTFWLPVLIGVLLTWIFLTKFSSGILGLVLVLYMFWLGKHQLKHYLLMSMGVVIAFMLFLWVNDLTVVAWIAFFKNGFYFASLLGYSTTTLILVKYVPEMSFLIGFLTIYYVVRQKWNKPYLVSLASVLFMSISVFLFDDDITFLSHLSMPAFYYLSSFIFYIFALELIIETNTNIKNPLLLLLLLPLIGIAGSDTVISINLFSNLYPLFLFIGTLMIKKNVLLKPIVWLSIVLSTLFFIAHVFVIPYRLGGTLFFQTEKITTWYGEEIYTTPQVKKMYSEATTKFKDIERPFPLVAKYDLPSMVYMLGAYSPVTPWYFGGNESEIFNKKALEKLNKKYYRIEP